MRALTKSAPPHSSPPPLPIDSRSQLNTLHPHYGNNVIATSKYTALSFLPRSLFEQCVDVNGPASPCKIVEGGALTVFPRPSPPLPPCRFRRIANVYFLGISVLMLIGQYLPKVFET